jgi:polysaccharide pyruvyl transferase WcaK-like protein
VDLKAKRSSGLSPKKRKIFFFGNFGVDNFGNQATLQAIHSNLRRLMPDAEFACICNFPEIVSESHNIAAFPINPAGITAWAPKNRVARLLRKALFGVPSEIYRWYQAFLLLKGAGALIVPGTGLITDVHDFYSWGPYGLFKWSVAAKLRRCKLFFVSVGAGPLYGALSRRLMKSALGLADFRSYRDASSLEYLKSIGFAVANDEVYPDLAFSLPRPVISCGPARRERRVVGLGLMTHDGMYGDVRHDTGVYRNYTECFVTLVKWLLDRRYDVRLLIGDHSDPVSDFRHLLSEQLPKEDYGRIIDAAQVRSFEELLLQFADTEFVVATRFHNIQFALFNNKPTVSISFHNKCESLMKAMGVSDYCIPIDQLEIDGLIRKFLDIERNSDKLKTAIATSCEEFRDALEEQYQVIVGKLALSAPRIGCNSGKVRNGQ